MNGVVDKNLKVYGVENLRVVDSSAIPMVSTANLQATVYAFAERAADLIKETYGMNRGNGLLGRDHASKSGATESFQGFTAISYPADCGLEDCR